VARATTSASGDGGDKFGPSTFARESGIGGPSRPRQCPGPAARQGDVIDAERRPQAPRQSKPS
jgi:hypothetical protein